MENMNIFLFVNNAFERDLHKEAEQICIPSRVNEEKGCVNLDGRLFYIARKDVEYRLGFYETYGDPSCKIIIKDSKDMDFIDCGDLSN